MRKHGLAARRRIVAVDRLIVWALDEMREKRLHAEGVCRCPVILLAADAERARAVAESIYRSAQ